MLKSLLFIFIGGGVGSIFRYLIDFYVQRNIRIVFPLGTLLANAIASFLIGFLVQKIQHHNLPVAYKYLFITGFCGGLSTFSTFSYENIKFVSDKQTLLSAVYIGISVTLCLLCTFIGIAISKRL